MADRDYVGVPPDLFDDMEESDSDDEAEQVRSLPT